MDKALLTQATSPDDTPTPGYMLSEIAKATTVSYPTCMQIQEFLLGRVAHRHHNVKYKALVVIRHVCRTGRPEFKRELTRHTAAIKDCLNFRGEPDPLRGDELNRRVRDAAREALDAAFDSQMPVTTSAVMAANRIQGIGGNYVPENTNAANSNSSGGLLGNLMGSISMMMTESEPAYIGHPGAGGSIAATTTVKNVSATGMVGIGSSSTTTSNSWLGNLTAGLTGGSSNTFNPATASTGLSDYSFASNRSNVPTPAVTYGVSGAPLNGAQSIPSIPLTASATVGNVGAAASDGSYERSLVESLCEPGGLKAVPAEKKLSDFLTAAITLNAGIVGDALSDVLGSNSWQSRTKALIVISQLVTVHSTAATHLPWWQSNVEIVREVFQGDSKASVRSQAAKTLRSITGESVTAGEGTPRAPARTAEASNSASLLDFEDNTPSPVPVTTAAPTTSAPVNLFDGLSMSPAVSVPVSPMYSKPSVVSPQPIPTVVTSNVGGFDFMKNSTPSDAPVDLFANLNLVPSAPESGVEKNAPQNILGFMDDISTTTTTATPAQLSSFSFLSAATSPSSAPTMVPPASTSMNTQSNTNNAISSAFDFDLLDAPLPATAAEALTPAPIAAAPAPIAAAPAPVGPSTAPPAGGLPHGMPSHPYPAAPFGYQTQGMPPQGMPPQGMPQGYPQYPGFPPHNAPAPYGYPPQGMPQSYPHGMPQGYPPQQMPQGYPPQHMPPYGYPHHAAGGAQQPMNGAYGVPNPLAPSMVNPVMPRKNIPDSTSPVSSAAKTDSFNFVSDAMSQMK